jgi:hypothetical protein
MKSPNQVSLNRIDAAAVAKSEGAVQPPREFEFHYPGSLISSYLAAGRAPAASRRWLVHLSFNVWHARVGNAILGMKSMLDISSNRDRSNSRWISKTACVS